MRRIVVAAGIVTLLSACIAGPGKLRSANEVRLPPAFVLAPEGANVQSLAALLPIQDPAFAALSAAALSEAPTLAAALARVERARAETARARADRLPTVNGSASVERERSNAAQFGPAGSAIDPWQTNYGINLSAAWDTDLFGQLRARQRAEQERLDAAGADAAAIRLALRAEIATTVIDWRTLERRQQALEADRAAALELARLSGSRERAGLSPGADRIQAESLVAGTERQLVALGSERARLIGRLVTLTGHPTAEIVSALAFPSPPLANPTPVPALPSTVLMHRPDVLAAGARLRAANADVAAAAAQRFPKLSLSGTLGLLSFGLDSLFSPDSVVASLGASIAGPLLDFGRIAADIDRSEAAAQEAFQLYRGSVYTALGDAEAGYGLVVSADAEALATNRERDALTRAARLADTRYRAGLDSFLGVLTARRAAQSASERAAAADGRAYRARVLLWQALGGDADWKASKRT